MPHCEFAENPYLCRLELKIVFKPNHMKKIFAIMIPVMMLAACQPKEVKAPALDPTDMDLSVKPGDNFFLYANGGWMKKNPLKPEYARFGSFDVLREQNVENWTPCLKRWT